MNFDKLLMCLWMVHCFRHKVLKVSASRQFILGLGRLGRVAHLLVTSINYRCNNNFIPVNCRYATLPKRPKPTIDCLLADTLRTETFKQFISCFFQQVLLWTIFNFLLMIFGHGCTFQHLIFNGFFTFDLFDDACA